MLKRFALLLAVLTWPAIALAAFFSPCCYNNSLNVTFTHVEIVGAGAITGITSVPSANLLLARTDQYGCYKSVNNSQWSELVTTNAMPASAVTVAAGGPIDAGGCEELVGDPSNIQNLWIFFNKNIYLSTNGGTSFSSTCYPAQASDLSNTGPAKTMSPRIAVDPNNSNVVYFSTHSAGLEVTYNQGSTCTAISTATIAAPTSNSGFLVAFDPSGGTTTSCAGGVALCTKSIYVSSYGTGVYHSNDGGQTWTLTTGTPTTHLYMTVDSTGVLWFVDNSNNNGLGVAHKYAASAWAAPTFTHNNILTSVAFDPNNCSTSATCHVVFMIGGGGTTGGTTALTQNGGGAWAVATGYTPSTTDAPWLANVWTTIGLFPNGAAFDNSGHVYTGLEGVGFTTPPTTATTLTMTSQTLGIEEAEVSSLSTSPNTSGSLLAGNWDVGSFTLSAPYNSPPTSSNHGCAGQTSFQHAYSIDWAEANPSDFACLSDNQQGYIGGTYTSYSGLSSNGGSTWGTFTVPSAISTGGHIGGCMAASSSTNILWAPTDGSSGATAPLYTTDSGSTWNFISVSGVTQGWGIQYYFSGRFCAADRVNAGT
ncbi:MAG: hypothetical protein KGI37_11070, partial [Alphaproteobacteria bacterium]|nr:hypothetical protein [Alphaproteobacteria bacterium]